MEKLSCDFTLSDEKEEKFRRDSVEYAERMARASDDPNFIEIIKNNGGVHPVTEQFLKEHPCCNEVKDTLFRLKS